MTSQTEAPANGQAEDGRLLTLPSESSRRPRIMSRKDAQELRSALKAPRLEERTSAMMRWAESFLEPEAATQVLAHVEWIAEG